MKAINGNCFIERHPMEKTFMGLEISEKALTKNYVGVCMYSDNDKFVGMELHVPHFGVLDATVDGREYALTKEEKLFAAKEGENWRPINGYIKIRKCVNDHIRDESGAIALYMTENNIESTNWVEILDVSDDCKKMKREYIGYYCVSPETSERLQRIGYTKDFCLHEDEIHWLTDGE